MQPNSDVQMQARLLVALPIFGGKGKQDTYEAKQQHQLWHTDEAHRRAPRGAFFVPTT